jgi:hypothetical protein
MKKKTIPITDIIEYLLLTLVLSILSHCIFQLFEEYDHSRISILSKLFNPTEDHSKMKKRKNSSIVLDISCEKEIKKTTQANKIRLRGSLCDFKSKPQRNTTSFKEKNQITILNEKNHFLATVFKKTNKRKYSTDYIEVDSGVNLINISMINSYGDKIEQKIEIIKK